MEYWLNGSIWAGIETSNSATGLQYWESGFIYGDIFPTNPETSTFVPIVMWFY